MPALPLSDLAPVSAAPWPAARMALRLLQSLGAQECLGAQETPGAQGKNVAAAPALSSGGVDVDREWSTTAQDWALSGAMALTGYENGPPLDSTGQPATLATAASIALELLTARAGDWAGNRVGVDGAALLGERAALLGYSRQGQISAGGSARLLPTADGWFALNLARPTDVELIPALVQACPDNDPWAVVAQWASAQPAIVAASRAQLLGLASAALPTPRPAMPTAYRSPWTVTALPCEVSKPLNHAPRVVNLGALWAGPLCAHLLDLAGADVIDVESSTRPDPSRTATPTFSNLLRAGHDRVSLDFGSKQGLATLAQLLSSADVVIEASRPRALENLGVPARVIMADRKQRIWARITGHGRLAGRENLIGFGDDAAVAGGLVGFDPSTQAPVFAGDAIADPLTGLLAALAVTACLLQRRSWVIDVSLRASAAVAVSAGPSGGTISASPPHVALRRSSSA